MTALLFPGQASQEVGMGHALRQASETGKRAASAIECVAFQEPSERDLASLIPQVRSWLAFCWISAQTMMREKER